MRAAICTGYGDPEVLQMREVADPVPGKDDVRIRIRATAVTASDCFVRSAVPQAALAKRIMLRLVVGLRKPRRSILGMVLAGDVEAIGANVRRYSVGDLVWGYTGFRFGCYAERTCLPATLPLLGHAPSNVTAEQAAAIPYGGLLASYFLQRAQIRPGQQIFIYGASGAIGTCALQLAKHAGATVTAASSGLHVDLVRSLGADVALDYTRDTLPAGRRYDVVLDAVGRRKSSPLKLACLQALTPTGQSISVDDATPRFRGEDLLHLRQLVEAGRLKAVIDRPFPLEHIADAHRYVEQGHKTGNVIVTIAD